MHHSLHFSGCRRNKSSLIFVPTFVYVYKFNFHIPIIFSTNGLARQIGGFFLSSRLMVARNEKGVMI